MSILGAFKLKEKSIRFDLFIEMIDASLNVDEETISKDNETEKDLLEKLEFLFGVCPSFFEKEKEKENELKENKKTVESLDQTELTDAEEKSTICSLSDEEEEGSLCLGILVILSSQGKIEENKKRKILNNSNKRFLALKERAFELILNYLKILPECKWSKQSQIPPEEYSFYLLDIAISILSLNENNLVVKDGKKRIGDGIVECIGMVVEKMKNFEGKFGKSRNFVGIMRGVMKALSERKYDFSFENILNIHNYTYEYLNILNEMETNSHSSTIGQTPRTSRSGKQAKDSFLIIRAFTLKSLSHILDSVLRLSKSSSSTSFDSSKWLPVLRKCFLEFCYLKFLEGKGNDSDCVKFCEFPEEISMISLEVSIKYAMTFYFIARDHSSTDPQASSDSDDNIQKLFNFFEKIFTQFSKKNIEKKKKETTTKTLPKRPSALILKNFEALCRLTGRIDSFVNNMMNWNGFQISNAIQAGIGVRDPSILNFIETCVEDLLNRGKDELLRSFIIHLGKIRDHASLEYIFFSCRGKVIADPAHSTTLSQNALSIMNEVLLNSNKLASLAYEKLSKIEKERESNLSKSQNDNENDENDEDDDNDGIEDDGGRIWGIDTLLRLGRLISSHSDIKVIRTQIDMFFSLFEQGKNLLKRNEPVGEMFLAFYRGFLDNSTYSIKIPNNKDSLKSFETKNEAFSYLLGKTLDIFNRTAFNFFSEMKGTSTSSTVHTQIFEDIRKKKNSYLSIFLEPIASLLRVAPQEMWESQNALNLFRRFWFYCVSLRFTEDTFAFDDDKRDVEREKTRERELLRESRSKKREKASFIIKSMANEDESQYNYDKKQKEVGKTFHLIEIIAKHSPSFVIIDSDFTNQKRNNNSTSLVPINTLEEIELVIGRMGSTESVQDLQQRFLDIVPKPLASLFIREYEVNINNAVHSCGITELMYLLSVFHLESLRATQTYTLQGCLRYLEDLSLFSKSREVYKMMACVVWLVFEMWLGYCKSWNESETEKWKENQIEKEMENDNPKGNVSTCPSVVFIVEREVCRLIEAFPHRIELIQKQIRAQIEKISNSFVFIFWSANCHSTLLDLLDTIYANIDIDMNEGSTSYKTIELPSVFSKQKKKGILPSTSMERKALFNSAFNLCVEWIKKGMDCAPNQLKDALQNYFVSHGRGYSEHVGYAIAMLLTTPKALARSLEDPDILSQKNVLLKELQESRTNKRSQMMMNNSRNNSKDDLASSRPDVVLASFLNVLNRNISYNMADALGKKFFYLGTAQTLRSCIKSDVEMRDWIKTRFDKDLDDGLKLCAAVLIERENIDFELLQLLIWGPVKAFTEDAMRSAVFAWHWLLSSRPDLEPIFLMELLHVWRYTQSSRLGIYKEGKDSNENLNNIQESNSDSEFSPHVLMIAFLSDRVTRAIFTRNSVITLFVRIVLLALQDEKLLSEKASSFAPRMRVVFLGMCLSLVCADETLASTLRERCLKCSLHWFSLSTRFVMANSSSKLLEDILVLETLLKLVEVEIDVSRAFSRGESSKEKEKERGRDRSPSSSNSDRETSKSHSKSHSHRSLSRSQRSRMSRMSVVKNLNERETKIGHAGLFLLGDVDYEEMNSLDDDANNNNDRDLTALFPESSYERSCLLKLLLFHELFRIKVFNFPRQMSELVDLSQVRRTLDESSLSFWRFHIETAWDQSPRLAIRVLHRFSNRINEDAAKNLRTVLEIKARKNAGQLTHEPLVSELLISVEDNVLVNYKELQWLCVWHPVPLIEALRMLGPTFSRCSYIGDLAIRSLRRCKVGEVTEAIPQLVQLLRYDRRRVLRKFILEATKRSQIFTHRMIWQLRNEVLSGPSATLSAHKTGVTPNMITLSRLAEGMLKDIMCSFNDRQKRLFDQEIGFFDRMADISKRLLPIQKKSPVEKKKALEAMLKEEKVPEFAYLPDMTDYRVKEIVANGAIPLKSAKKVPILVPFLVQKRKKGNEGDMDSDESDNKNEKIRKGLIFKSGDDCRMDQLALGLISRMKKMMIDGGMECLGNSVCDYGVIPTSQGCGIISVIENSGSLHEIKGVHDSLMSYFVSKFGNSQSVSFNKARRNFIWSIVAYSIICYSLAIKDRHNGNIMIQEMLGYLIHIDFGFILDISPGGEFGIEKNAPFKLTKEYTDIINLNNNFTNKDEPYALFIDMLVKAYFIIIDYQNARFLSTLIDIIVPSDLPCFKSGKTLKNFQQRLSFNTKDEDALIHIIKMLNKADENVFTKFYDRYQLFFELINN